MKKLNLINENNEILASIDFIKNLEANKIDDGIFKNPSLTKKGKELNIDINNLNTIFINVSNKFGLCTNYLVTKNNIEQFKENNSIETFSNNLIPINFNINAKEIKLHPLINLDTFIKENRSLKANHKNIRFLLENGFEIERNPKDKIDYITMTKEIFNDYSNLIQDVFFLVIKTDKKVYLSYEKPKHIEQIDFYKDHINIELVNNFVNYTEKVFGFKWDQDKIIGIESIFREEINRLKKIFDKHNNDNKILIFNINRFNTYTAMKTLGYMMEVKDFESDQKNLNLYLENFIEKPFQELFRSFKNANITEILHNDNVNFNDNKIKDLNLIFSRYNKDVIKSLKENGFELDNRHTNYSENFITYFSLNKEKDPITGLDRQTIYFYKFINQINDKYRFVKNEDIIDYIKTLNNNNIDILEDKVKLNTKTLEEFISKYDIKEDSQQYKDLMTVFNEKQNELYLKIEKEQQINEKKKPLEKIQDFFGFNK